MTPTLVSPQNDVWKWLQKFHTGDVVCHHSDRSSASDCNFPFTYDQSEAIPRYLNSMKFLQSFLRRHFTGKPVVVLKKVGCFLRLSDGCSVQLMQGCDAAGRDPSSCSFPKAPFIYMETSCHGWKGHFLTKCGELFSTWETKSWPRLKIDPPSQDEGWPHCSTIMILYTPKKCNNAWANII